MVHLPETRTINQCTLTPVDHASAHRHQDFRPGEAPLKLNVLSVATQNGQLAKLAMASSDPGHRHDALADIAARMVDDPLTRPDLSTIGLGDVYAFARELMVEQIRLIHEALAAVSRAQVSDATDGRVLTEPAVPRTVERVEAAENADAVRLNHPLPRLEREPTVQVGTSHDAVASLAMTAQMLSHGHEDLLRAIGIADRADVRSAAGAVSRVMTAVIQQINDGIHMIGDVVERSPREPVGYLHLERMRFTPVGYRQGELVYSVPLVPGETIRVSHREWSKTTTEFATLVQTSQETAVEDKIAEKSELTESANTQRQHSSSFTTSASASGGFGPMSVSASVGYSAQNAEAASRASSASKAREVTRQASSRSKVEHKVTFKVTTSYEVEDQSYRELSNSTDKAVRWDYYRLMKMWQIDLFRYGVRLTYDLVVPEPAALLLEKYARLVEIEDKLKEGNPFSLTPGDIGSDNYIALGKQYGVPLDPPPDAVVYVTGEGTKSFSERKIEEDYIPLKAPAGYKFTGWTSSGVFREILNGVRVASIYDWRDENISWYQGGSEMLWKYTCNWTESSVAEAQHGTTLSLLITARAEPTGERLTEWRTDCLRRLSDAATGMFQADQLALRQERDDLTAWLTSDDVLYLRKIEREELMKAVLRWLVGPAFRFYDETSLPKLLVHDDADLDIFMPTTGAVVAGPAYERMLRHGDLVAFLHQAIEWENVNYVLYPYFWTDIPRWQLKADLRHPDPEHREFLRAGAARVVLTIREGFESAFLAFVETNDIDAKLPDNHPYITVAEELKAMAQTNYPYTPSLDDTDDPANLVDSWHEFTPTGALDVVAGTPLGDGV